MEPLAHPLRGGWLAATAARRKGCGARSNTLSFVCHFDQGSKATARRNLYLLLSLKGKVPEQREGERVHETPQARLSPRQLPCKGRREAHPLSPPPQEGVMAPPKEELARLRD